MKPMAKFKLAFLFAATVAAVVSGTTLIFPDGKLWAHDAGSSMHQDAHSSAVAPADEVEIVLREGGQPLLLKGQQTHGHVIGLVAGQPTVLAFRNEDTIAREFVSPLFTRADIHFVGRATGIFRKDAVGFRLNPGSALTLQFVAPYSGFPKMYDLIWCRGDHDKEPDTELQELLIVITEEQ
ncbi:MAG: hypothetical protein KGS09_11830 [Nitrospirae bacterium]|nr:hypothetical protein [Nitrospirota bacterium]MBU6481220.1 hypothetical protein [Nitrospirota bacterium]MDE3042647.1 hypothetical protein [Nitrospirota bacterium]MDE3049725.1 hypothetical protein [Nitrospirota bacterium]